MAGQPAAPTGARHRRLRSRRTARPVTFLITISLAAAFIGWYRPPRQLDRPVFVTDSAYGMLVRDARLSPTAFGRSGAVHISVALPGQALDYPLELTDDSLGLRYAWARASDDVPVDSERTLTGDTVIAPSQPGFYRLTLFVGAARRVVDGLTVAVLVPFEAKKGPSLDGYRIGTYRGEHGGAHADELPEGFLRVTQNELELPVTSHLRLGELLAHDGQDQWPRFAAVDPRLLDKLELVVERLTGRRPEAADDLEVNVHSGYRTPAYNRRVRRAAGDSRHQYGDALDISIDADGNGRVDARDARLVAAAVDSVEAEYPDLVGGMGVYTSARYRHPYVHIDARGRRARWRG